MTNRPPFKRRRLGRRLRDLRLRKRLTLEEAAAMLDMNRTSLTRVEKGEYRATVHIVRSMMDLYDIYEPGLLDDARDALKPPWYPLPRDDMGYVGLEDDAELVREFCGPNLPGLLQIEPYARALFEANPRMPSQKFRDEQVAVRLFRQQRLRSRENPLEYVAIVDEAALRREVGGTEVLRQQLKHLVEEAARPTVTLQVLPLQDGAHAAMDGGFSLLSFPDYPDMLYIGYATGSLHIEDKDEVQMARRLFGQLHSQALGPDDSVALLEKLSAELGSR